MGFVLSVVGISWRMLWHRREIAVVVDGDGLRVGGRAELYPRRYRAELEDLRRLLAGAPDGKGAG